MSLIETRQFEEARQLMADPYFSALFDDLGIIYLTFWQHYYSGNYEQAGTIIEDFPYYHPFDRALVYAQQNDPEKVRTILNKADLGDYTKAIVFAILKERDSMYYYMDKENKIRNKLLINGAIELNDYRKEDRYKAFLKKNYLPLTAKNN